jgi:hypothetical protein
MVALGRLTLRWFSLIPNFLLAVLFTAVPAGAQQGLTSGDIIKMRSAGLSESIILSSVNNQPAAYDTSTDGLLALKQANVPERVRRRRHM